MKRTLLIFIIATMTSLYSFAQVKPVSYSDGAQKLTGFVSAPKAGKGKPGILILPAWLGINDHFKGIAEKLSASGYYAFVADIYGEGNYPKDKKEAGERSGYYKNHVMEYRKRVQLALDELVKQGADPDNIVVIGYCFGGAGALEAARANFKIKGVVSFHGSYGRDTTLALSPIAAKVLVCHGAIDPYTSEAQLKAFQKEMNDAKADWQMIYYANAVHSFTEPAAGNDNSKGAAYNEKADKRSWEAMMTLLKDVFGK
jgi:dienelactone hydrolase